MKNYIHKLTLEKGMELHDTIYFEIYKDIWNLQRRALPVVDDCQYWERVVNEAAFITDKYKNSPQARFSEKLVFCILNELQRIQKEGGNNASNNNR